MKMGVGAEPLGSMPPLSKHEMTGEGPVAMEMGDRGWVRETSGGRTWGCHGWKRRDGDESRMSSHSLTCPMEAAGCTSLSRNRAQLQGPTWSG